MISKTQHIDIRSVLDYEISSDPEIKILSQVTNLLLNTDNLPTEDDEKAKNQNCFLFGATTTGLDKGVILFGIAALMGAGAIEITATR